MTPDPRSSLRTVIVADDDHDLADALCEWIALSSDWNAVAAYGSGEALARALSSAPDAILLDMEMCGADGFDTARLLARAVPGKTPALFALTGNARLRDAASQDSRFWASMLKPADLDSLLRLLDGASPAH